MTIEFRHVLVPVDFGEPSQLALREATSLAKRFGSQLTLVHVFEIPAYIYVGTPYVTTDLFGTVEEAARQQLDKTLREVQAAVPGAKAVLRNGAPSAEILAVIEALRPDLVIIGTHGRKGVSHALLGSVAEKIVRLSPTPVLTFRGKT